MKNQFRLSKYIVAAALSVFPIHASSAQVASAQNVVANNQVDIAAMQAEINAQNMAAQYEEAQLGANSRVRTPETPLSDLPPLEVVNNTPVEGGFPVTALKNDSRRGNDNRRDERRNNRGDRRNQNRSRWNFDFNVNLGNSPQNTVVVRPGQRYVDSSGRVVVIGDNNTVIINQGGYSYPYAGYPTYGYPSHGYPSYGYPSYGYPYDYGYQYGYPSTTTYTFGNSPFGHSITNPYSGGYNSSYSNNGAYHNYSSSNSSSAWMNSPGTISSTTIQPYQNGYPNGGYGANYGGAFGNGAYSNSGYANGAYANSARITPRVSNGTATRAKTR